MGGEILPIEIRSGKDYEKHAALSNVMANKDYSISKALVFYNGNVAEKDKIIYYPICMLMFVERGGFNQNMVYKLDLSGLH